MLSKSDEEIDAWISAQTFSDSPRRSMWRWRVQGHKGLEELMTTAPNWAVMTLRVPKDELRALYNLIGDDVKAVWVRQAVGTYLHEHCQASKATFPSLMAHIADD